jgi:antitoxin component YwqK of YwqJK toxin-antitoxin module
MNDNLVEEYYDCGQIKSRKKNGEQTLWYSNGKMEYQVFYVNGKKNGVEKRWCSDGKIKYLIYYNNGKIEHVVANGRRIVK